MPQLLAMFGTRLPKEGKVNLFGLKMRFTNDNNKLEGFYSTISRSWIPTRRPRFMPNVQCGSLPRPHERVVEGLLHVFSAP